MRKEIVVGIDPGSSICGVCVLEETQIIGAFNVKYSTLWDKISHFLINPKCTVVIEDIRPYSIQLTPQIIDTCKMIGEMVYRLRKEVGLDPVLISRGEVKKWVFDEFPEICLPVIDKKFLKKRFLSCNVMTKEAEYVFEDGRPFKMRRGSFVSVNDRMVEKSMQFHYGFELPAPGDGYPFGLKDHSWQALGVATAFIHKGQKLALPVSH